MPPSMLIESLQGIRRRVKLLGVVYGLGLVVAAAVALLLAVVLLDWQLLLPTAPRLILNFAALGALGYALARYVVRPALTRLTLSDLAGRLEHVFPQFDDSLRSTVDFLRPRDGNVPGSEVMKTRTIERATTLAKDIDLDSAVAARPVYFSAGAALLSLAMIVSLSLFVSHRFPDFFHAATDRLFGGNAAYPKSVEIEMLAGIPERVPAGKPVDVRMKLAKGTARQAIIHYRYDNGPWEQEIMDKDASGVYAASLPARLEGNHESGKLQIRLEAGDDEKDLSPVTIVPRLEVRSAIAMVTPPPYAKLPAVPVSIGERPVVTALGSTIDLVLNFNKSLDEKKGLVLEPSDKSRKAPQVTWTYPAPGQAVGHFSTAEGFKANDPYRFTVRATDTDGFDSNTSQEYQVIVHDDALPTIVIEVPPRSEDRTPDATVPLKAVAEDDYGIEGAQLVVNGASATVASKNWVIDLVKGETIAPGVGWTPADSTTERKRYRLDYAWELEKLQAGLKPGDVLEFFIRVKDNFRLGGNEHPWVESGKLRITVISHEQWEKVVGDALSQARNEIGQIKKSQESNKTETDQQAKETSEKGKFDDAQRQTVNRLANQQSTATGQAKNASDKLKELVQKMTENKSPQQGAKEIAEQVAKQMEQTAEGPMKDAAQQLNQAKENKSDPKASAAQQKKDAQQTSAQMNQSARQQQQAAEQLDQAMSKLNDFGGLQPSIAKLEEIKKQQEALDKKYAQDMKDALGKKPEEMSPEQKEKLDKMTKEQDKLAQETQKAIQNMDEKGDKLSKTDPTSSKAMKDAAQTGKQQGIPQKQSNPKDNNGASQQMQQNQQASAQKSQKEVELGLEMMLDKLKEAEQRKLMELQKDLETAQALIHELIRRQAGHNIDNLLLQDAKKVTDLTEEDRKVLFEQAERDYKKLPEMKPDLANLTPSQEQTERNCRDYAKRKEIAGLPDATAGSRLTAAAGKMEQAIVYLRKSQLADAYAPPQLEALRALVDAKKAVDEAKKKADQEINDKKEEAIKQAYVKLLEAQKKLDTETATIDGAPRDDQGNLRRAESIRLAAMPGEQGKLSDDASKLGERLEGLGSVVYVWANKDIVTSMGEVKDDLAKPETGKPTQAEQKRIEEQLQAMIDNLVKKQQDKKFAQKGGGGGGGGGKKPPPKMPTDIELRLLKDLQVAVNRSTQKISAEKVQDAHKLLGLGGRQGELRGLLGQLLEKASRGQVKLGPEPDKKDQLPEEASKEDVDNQELEQQLLGGKPEADTVETSVKLTGDRMGRSRQRLVDNDPGKTTQEIQKRIVDGLDNLIQLAQQQQAQSKPGQGQGEPQPGEKPGEAKAGENQGQQNANAKGKPKPGHAENGQNPAQDSSLTDGSDPQADVSKDIREKSGEWGKISPRDRDAMLQGANDQLIDTKYEKFIKDYYRELAKKASER